jgi:phosphohistidine swiveling domain-containing protein
MSTKAVKHIFKKTLSRDSTLFVQSLWARSMNKRLGDKTRLKNPYSPTFVHFFHEDIIEIWENERAVDWLLDYLVLINKRDGQFLSRILKEYLGLLQSIKKLRSRGTDLSKEELKRYLELIYEAALGASLFFYVGGDERNPKSIRQLAIKGRKLEDFFAVNDEFIKCYLVKSQKITKEQASLVLPEEVFGPISKAILSKRQKNLVLVDGKYLFLGSLNSFLRRHPEYIFNVDKKVHTGKNLKGQVAFPGIVQGFVRIVRKQKDLSKVGRGDIIISPMTTPDFMPAMRRAAAFVTDEGGITCHAAIIAREYKKPCVIGTKSGTTFFKDGDLAEVDANKGIVKIVK